MIDHASTARLAHNVADLLVQMKLEEQARAIRVTTPEQSDD
jgi:hypothetical protein